MPDWIKNLIVKWLLSNLTSERLKEWAETAKMVVVPWLRTNIMALIDTLETQAKKSTTTVDDTLVAALRTFLDVLLPDTETKL